MKSARLFLVLTIGVKKNKTRNRKEKKIKKRQRALAKNFKIKRPDEMVGYSSSYYSPPKDAYYEWSARDFFSLPHDRLDWKQREAAFSCSGRNRFNSSSFFSEWMDHERMLAIYQQLACVPRTITKRGLQPSGSNHTNLSLQLEGNHHPIPAVQTYMARFWQSLESKMCLQQKI